jgi:putative ABC transport system permease protein
LLINRTDVPSDKRIERGSLLATRVLQSMLYQTRTGDPSVLLAVVAGFVAAALVGCYLPARRASKIDPSEALRSD